MAKTKKGIVGETVGTEDTVFQAKVAQVAREIEAILVENKLGLQPFIQYTANGIFPQVKLVKTDGKEETK